jgi:hypothetical protein
MMAVLLQVVGLFEGKMFWVECLRFWDRFDILLEKRLSGASELRYIMVYGKSQ